MDTFNLAFVDSESPPSSQTTPATVLSPDNGLPWKLLHHKQVQRAARVWPRLHVVADSVYRITYAHLQTIAKKLPKVLLSETVDSVEVWQEFNILFLSKSSFRLVVAGTDFTGIVPAKSMIVGPFKGAGHHHTCLSTRLWSKISSATDEDGDVDCRDFRCDVVCRRAFFPRNLFICFPRTPCRHLRRMLNPLGISIH